MAYNRLHVQLNRAVNGFYQIFMMFSLSSIHQLGCSWNSTTLKPLFLLHGSSPNLRPKYTLPGGKLIVSILHSNTTPSSLRHRHSSLSYLCDRYVWFIFYSISVVLRSNHDMRLIKTVAIFYS